jgi:inhibitor of cysteine peptidase
MAHELTLSEAENGQSLTVHVGDRIVLDLAENSAAGYRWVSSSFDTNLIELESQHYQSTSDAVGSAGLSVWRFRAKATGRTRIELKKVRPWEPSGAAAAETYSVTLEIVL